MYWKFARQIPPISMFCLFINSGNIHNGFTMIRHGFLVYRKTIGKNIKSASVKLQKVVWIVFILLTLFKCFYLILKFPACLFKNKLDIVTFLTRKSRKF